MLLWIDRGPKHCRFRKAANDSALRFTVHSISPDSLKKEYVSSRPVSYLYFLKRTI